MVNTSARKAGGAWFDSMRRESIILLFRSVVISSRCYFGDKNKRNYNERENHNKRKWSSVSLEDIQRKWSSVSFEDVQRKWSSVSLEDIMVIMVIMGIFGIIYYVVFHVVHVCCRKANELLKL